VWNYHDDDLSAPDGHVSLMIVGMSGGNSRVLVRHYRVDGDHSNAFTVWKVLGSPQHPTAQQYAQMERAGQLEELGSPEWKALENGMVSLEFTLPRHGVSLIELSW